MSDNRYNIEMHQGSTYELQLIIKNANNTLKNLVSYSASMQIRPNYPSNTITESLTTSNGEIVINTTSSSVNLLLDHTRTANIYVDLNNGMPPKTKYVYDLELTDGDGKVSKIIFGDVIVYGQVTR